MSPTPEAELPATPSRWRRWWPWINGVATAVLLMGGVWYLSQSITLPEVRAAIAAANGWLILVGLIIFVSNGSLKAWRWQVLLAPRPNSPRIRYTAVFWAIWLGQFVNSVLPFLRLGEIGRAYAINHLTGYSKTQAVSTMVIEKSVEVIFLGFTVLLLIPFAALPPRTEQLGIVLAGTAVVILTALALITYQTDRVIRMLQRILNVLPQRLAQWFNRRLVSGLQGLAALRHGRSLWMTIFVSIFIVCLDIALPYVLILAFALPLEFWVAVLLNVAVALVTTPPTAPGELGIFEAAVLFVMAQVGQADTAVLFSYALVFHLCTLLPKIVLGSLAALQTKWSWRHLNPSPG